MQLECGVRAPFVGSSITDNLIVEVNCVHFANYDCLAVSLYAPAQKCSHDSNLIANRSTHVLAKICIP